MLSTFAAGALCLATAAAAQDLAAQVKALNDASTAVERYAVLKNDSDFVFDFLNPPAAAVAAGGDGGVLTSAKTSTFPALLGAHTAVTVGWLKACALNTPHTHPRSAELQVFITGESILTGAFPENGIRFVQNEVKPGQAVLFDKGSVHFQQNLGCEEVLFLSAFGNEDPGTVQIAQAFISELPSDIVSATLGDQLSAAEIDAVAAGLPTNVAVGLAECRARCGLNTSIPSGPLLRRNEFNFPPVHLSHPTAIPQSAANAYSNVALAAAPDADVPLSESRFRRAVIGLGAATGVLALALIALSGWVVWDRRQQGVRRGKRIPLFDSSEFTLRESCGSQEKEQLYDRA